ncbi:MAG: hypothetical protein HXS54_12505 [Theionarchaea archaeon]|nr:hypothetical protein [Theionarchaea archaeon]
MKKVFIGIGIMAMCITGCAEKSQETRSFLVGIGPIPRQFPGTEETWLEMFEMIPDIADIVLAQSEWRDTKEESGIVPEIMRLVYDQKRKYGSYKISYGLSFMKQGAGSLTTVLDTESNPTNNWTNKDAQEKYKHAALTLCKDYKAEYLALAIEVNTYYQHPQGSKEDFKRFVEFYIQTYDELKKEFPDTKIFVTFQLEELKGLGDASCGYDVEPAWELLEMFDGRLDVIAFTTYPFLEYNSPEDIPDTYYSIIDDLPDEYKTTEIAFTEIGWSSQRPDENAQITFLETFLEQTREFDLAYVVWVFMHDLSSGMEPPGFNVGLRRYNGEPKEIWYMWKELKEIPYRNHDKLFGP